MRLQWARGWDSPPIAPASRRVDGTGAARRGSAAGAASWYASPGGGTTPGCPQDNPCSVQNALAQSGPGDEVVALGGTYNVSGGLVVQGGPLLRGVDGPLPTISLGAGGQIGLSTLYASATTQTAGPRCATSC